MESAAGPSKQHTQCSVYGCAVSSLNHPDSSFFAVPNDPTRSEQWLKLMHREELVGSNQVVFVCYRHFSDHEIISTPFRNLLRKDVAPSMNLPGHGTRDRFVQVQPWQFDEYVQTDFKDPFQLLIGRKTVASQIGPTLVTELRKRRALLEDYESHMKQLKEFEGGSDSAHAKIFFAACDHFLSPRLAELVKARVNIEGKKHTLEYKVFCLNLYHISPRAYSLISEDFDLPSISKLKQINIPLTSAINEAIMDAFKIKVNNMTETETYCSVAVDVMSIKSRLFYSAKQDRIIGFHEIDGVQTPIPAHFAVVLVLKGIYGNWTQPIGYALLSKEKCHEDVSKWIDKILSKLLAIGLKVKTLVCTAKSKLLNESKMRLVSVDQPFFLINGVKIYYIYDIPYMFRQVRNFFLTHDFHYENNDSKCVAKFSDVEEFYEHDKKRSLPIANDLTNYHLHPSMQEKRNTKFAAELMSKKVAMGMETYIDFKLMHAYARDTVYFVDLVHNLYEVLNSSVISPKTYHGKKREIKLLKNAILFLRTLKVIKTDTDIDNTKKATFIKGLQITIQSIISLFEELKKDSFKYLLVGRLNLTVTENLFKRIKARGKLTIKPTSQRFSLMYRKFFFGYFLKGTHQAGTEEFGKLIAQIHELSESMNSPDNYGINASDSLTQTQLKDLQEVAKFAEGIDSFRFCGILLRKCVENHKDCDVLKYFVNAYEITHGLRATSDEVLPVKPEPISTEDLFAYVATMEDKFREVFETSSLCRNIVSTIFEMYKLHPFLNSYALCPCFPVEFFQKLFIRVFNTNKS